MDPPTNTPSRQPLVDDHDVHPNQSDDHMLFQPYSSQCTVTHGRQHAAASLASGSAAPQLTQSLLPPVNIPIYLDSHGSETDFQIIKMRKVTPRSIAYIACQVSSFDEVNDRHYDQICRFDSHSLLSPRGGLLMGILITYNFGGPSWTSSNDPQEEKRVKGLRDSWSGGLGVLCSAPAV